MLGRVHVMGVWTPPSLGGMTRVSLGQARNRDFAMQQGGYSGAPNEMKMGQRFQPQGHARFGH